MARDHLTIRLPWPPSVNHYYTPQRRGPQHLKAGLSETAKKYRELAVAMIWQQHGRCTPTEWRLTCRIVLHPPSSIDRDLDNFSKGIMDAMQHAGIYKNDAQIDRLLVVRGVPVTPGRALVTLRRKRTIRQLLFDLEKPF